MNNHSADNRKCIVCGKSLPKDGHKANLCEACYDEAVKQVASDKGE